MHNAARQREGGRAGAAKLLEVGCCCGGEEAHSLIAVADSLEEEDRNAVWWARCMICPRGGVAVRVLRGGDAMRILRGGAERL